MSSNQWAIGSKRWVELCEANGIDTTRMSPLEVYLAAGKLIQNKRRKERQTPQWMKKAAGEILRSVNSAGHDS